MTTDDSPEYVIRCSEHGGDIASADTEEEARELAEMNGAHLHPESGDWTCEPCYQKEMAYWSSMVPSLRAEHIAAAYEREAEKDPAAAYLRAKGEL